MESLIRPLLRIALLGADFTTPSIVRAVLDSGRFEIAGVCETEGAPETHLPSALGALMNRAWRLDSWESMLDSEVVDAVVVARGPDQDRRAEQLRKLIQVGVPILASHPVVDSMLVYYELDMIRRETGSVALPLLAERHHPALEELSTLVRQGAQSTIGKAEHLTVSRSVTGATKESVTEVFARDVDLIRAIAGDMTRLGAMAGGTGDEAYGSLGVQMSGPAGVAARWSVMPTPTDRGAQVTLVGNLGKATVEARSDGEPWTLKLEVNGQVKTEHFEKWDPAAAALAELARAIDGHAAEPDWVDAARSVELAETIDRSLKKSRTIELYYEDYTEEGTFKGTMTSVGCGLLLLAMLLLGAVGIAEQMGMPYVRYWPYLLLGSCGVFLTLQFLLFASRKRQAEAVDRGSSQRLSSSAPDR